MAFSIKRSTKKYVYIGKTDNKSSDDSTVSSKYTESDSESESKSESKSESESKPKPSNNMNSGGFVMKNDTGVDYY